MYKERLKKLREENNLNQSKIAQIINLSPKTYSVYEIESDIIPLKHLNKIANYFECSLDYIFKFTTTKQYTNSRSEINNKLYQERLKELRKNHNLTQTKLAELLNIDQSTIAKYEKGKNVIATAFLYEICFKYQISADYLLGKID